MKLSASTKSTYFGILAMASVLALGPVAWASTTVNYVGQGFSFDGTTYNLNDERCGLTGQNDANDGGTGQFADWNGEGQPYETGQGYLVWVLTANNATEATITLPNPDGEGTITEPMIQVGGTFKYASQYYSYAELLGTVYATYQGTVRGTVRLVVSHGCQPFEGEGAWCSPGFWRNASDAAWALTGYAKTDLFNDTVVPEFYNPPNADENLTIGTVLAPGDANRYGHGDDNTAYPGLNAFNATGAFLTDQIPGYNFDPDRIGDEDACPIDNHGNFKEQQ
jgi:hypothetical protein